MLPICLRILFLLTLALPCFGASTFYVSTTGNDSTGDGSIGNPWLTIRKGVITMAGGDTLNIRGGTYPDDGFDIEEIKSGPSPATPTLIQSYPGEFATYAPHAGAGQNEHGVVIQLGKSNVVLNGWAVDAHFCTSDGIKVTDNSTNVVLTNMTVIGCGTGMGILVTGISEGDPSWTTITHCTLITNGWNPVPIVSPPLHQIYIQTTHTVVENCTMICPTNDGGGTIGIHYFGSGASDAVFRNNYITNGNTGILAAGTLGSNVLIYNNVIIGSYGYGISVQRMKDVRVLNNTCYTNNAQINVDQSTNIWVENNIAVGGYAANPGGIFVQNNSSNVFVRNNLGYGSTVSGVQTFDFRTFNAQSVTTNANLFTYVSIEGVTAGPNNIYNANFVGIGSGNFRCQRPSDAIETGMNESSIFTTDFDGTVRTVPWDIGAFELQTATAVLNGAILRGAIASPP